MSPALFKKNMLAYLHVKHIYIIKYIYTYTLIYMYILVSCEHKQISQTHLKVYLKRYFSIVIPFG